MRSYPASNYMFKVNNRNSRTRCEICLKLTIKTPEWCHWHANWVWLISIKALKGSINLALWSIFQFGHKHWLKSRTSVNQNLLIDRKVKNLFWHMNGNYPSQKINWRKYEYFKKSSFIQVQKPFNSWIILALGYLGH